MKLLILVTSRTSVRLESLDGPVSERQIRLAIKFLKQAAKDLTQDQPKERQMGERNEVVIPAGTLIHVGGMPFETKADTTVYGQAENLAIGLEMQHAASESKDAGQTA